MRFSMKKPIFRYNKYLIMRELRMLHEVKVVYKPSFNQSELHQISSGNDAVKLIRRIWEDDIQYRERFYMVMLDRANKVIGFTLIGVGGSSAVTADVKMILQTALLTHAQAIIIAHNHPSGNLKPSQSDIHLTKRVKEGSDIMDITLIDHIILTENSYYSFAENGIL